MCHLSSDLANNIKRRTEKEKAVLAPSGESKCVGMVDGNDPSESMLLEFQESFY
jgi:hypothetical protein